MAGINIKRFLNNFTQNYNRPSTTANTTGANSSSGVQNSNRVPMDTSKPNVPSGSALSNWGQGVKNVAQSLKLNVLQNADRATYLKEVLNLPKNLNEFVYMVQRKIPQEQLNKTLAQQQSQQTPQMHPKTISNIQSQILSQQSYLQNAKTMQNLTGQNKALPNSGQSTSQNSGMMGQSAMANSQLSGQIIRQDLNLQRNNAELMKNKMLTELNEIDIDVEAQETAEIALTKELQSTLKKLDIMSGGMIKLDVFAQLIQKNGKAAIAKLIMNMTEASKSGVSDLSQMKEMAKFINASISIAAENNPQKTLKLFLLMYLPWLPLEEGVGFDVEVQERKEESGESSDSILVITVTTLNYGVVKATLFLETSNSVHVDISSSDKFPKKELKLRIEKEQGFYSMESVLSFKTDDNIKQNSENKQAASINMSQTTEINPFLLLMAHTLIKHIIEIDNNTTLGLTTHEDKF